MAVKSLRASSTLTQRIRKLHPSLRARIRSALEQVLRNPDAGKELREELLGLRSFRVGRYRIVYRVEKDAIVLVNVGPRSVIYEETATLLTASEE